jgi:hypothetical protein
MALDNFIPALWSARLLENLESILVYASVCNRDYEGEITGLGSSVKINSIGELTIGTYTKNSNMSAAETLTDAQTTLLVDQARYFHFQVDDIDQAQQQPKVMDAAMRRAAYGLRKAVDGSVADLYTDAGNTLGTDVSPKSVGTGGTDDNAYELLVDLGVLLDDDDIPADNRWVVVPPWYHGLLLKDQRFVSFGTEQNVATLHNGRVGMAAGFTIYKSSQVNNTAAAKYKIMAGHPMAITLAQQIMQVEAYRPELRFADASKGLLVYGHKVVRPAALACLTADIAS